MKTIKAIWTMIGNNNSQRFWRLMIFVWSIVIATNLIINVGYEKEKGGWYWKPADVGYHKTVSK